MVRYVTTLEDGIEIAYNQSGKKNTERCIHKHTHFLVRMMTLLCVNHVEYFLSSCSICIPFSLLLSNSLAGNDGEEGGEDNPPCQSVIKR